MRWTWFGLALDFATIFVVFTVALIILGEIF